MHQASTCDGLIEKRRDALYISQQKHIKGYAFTDDEPPHVIQVCLQDGEGGREKTQKSDDSIDVEREELTMKNEEKKK